VVAPAGARVAVDEVVLLGRELTLPGDGRARARLSQPARSCDSGHQPRVAAAPRADPIAAKFVGKQSPRTQTSRPGTLLAEGVRPMSNRSSSFRRTRVACSMVALLSLAPSPSLRAQSPPESSAKDLASSILRGGNAEYSTGHFEEALTRYKLAWSIFPSTKLLLSIADAAERLGRTVYATRTLEQFLGAPGDAEVAQIEGARRDLSRLVSLLGEVRWVAPPGDGTLSIDGVAQESKGARLEPGNYRVRLARRATTLLERTVLLRPGKVIELRTEEAPPRPWLPPGQPTHLALSNRGKWVLGFGVGGAATTAAAVIGLTLGLRDPCDHSDYVGCLLFNTQ
jgi:hypothetical protein